MSASFNSLITNLISDLNKGYYPTGQSLLQVIEKFKSLPRSVQFDHSKEIDNITIIINSFNNYQLLSKDQINTLLFALNYDPNSNIMEQNMEQNDFIIETTRQLLFDLNRNLLTSDIGNYIANYLDILNLVLLEDNQKYALFYENVITVLENNGWTQHHSFTTAPDRIELFKGLEQALLSYIAMLK